MIGPVITRAVSDRQKLAIAFGTVYFVLLFDWPLVFLYEQNQVAYWALDFTKFVVVPGLVLWVLTHSTHVTMASLGLALPRSRATQVRLVLVTVACALALPFIWWFPKPFPWSFLWGAVNPEFDISGTIPRYGIGHYIGLAYLSLTPAFVEEVFFRGLLGQLLCHGGDGFYGRWGYILASATLFGSIHWEFGSTAVENAFVYGIAAAWVYCRFQSVWPLIFGHLITDWMAFAK